MRKIIQAAALIILVSTFNAHAAAPNLLTYQGRFKDAGQAVTGLRSIEIYLCDAETSGNCYTSGAQAIAVTNGLFRSTFTVPAAANFAAGEWYLEIWIAGTRLLPRERLSSSVYSLVAATAAWAGGADWPTITNKPAVTTQGNVFNAASQLVQLGSDGKLPSLDGSNLTGVQASGLADGSVTAAKLSVAAINAGGKVPALTSTYFASLDGSALTNINASQFDSIGLATSTLRSDLAAVVLSTGPLVNSANWNTAYGWGNHAAAGYLNGSAVAADTTTIAGNLASEIINRGNADNALDNRFSAVAVDTTTIAANLGGALVKTGGAMSGPLTLAGSTLTVTGSAFSVAGSTFVIKDGNVGVGTANPSNQLVLAHDTGMINKVFLDGTINDGAVKRVVSLANTDGSNYGGYLALGNKFSPLTGVLDGATVLLSGAPNQNSYISVGNVGIGTTTPGAKLEVAGQVKITGGNPAANRVLTSDADGLAEWKAPAAQPGDNLGNHLATATLNMAYFNVDNVSTVTATAFVGDGSSLTGIAGDDLGNHAATQQLKMGNYAVISSSDMTAARYQINGDTVLAVLPGTGSIGLGVGAGSVNAGNGNSFMGRDSGYSNVGGNNNSFLGDSAGYANTTGTSNSFVGFNAGYSNTTSSNNSFIGVAAGYSTIVGGNNSFVGAGAGRYNISGAANVFIGFGAGRFTESGSANAVFGSEAGRGISGNSFSSSTLVGYRAGYALTTGSDNILIGFKAGDSLTTGTRNIIIGYDQDAPAVTTNNHLNIGGVIYGDLTGGNVGLGTTSPGAKLEVAGQVKITGGNPVANRVLTSDASGLAEWKDPAAQPGDNLGNHLATATLNMAYYNIDNVSTVTATAFVGDGSSLTGIAGDDLGNHTATQRLDMGNNQLINVSSLTVIAPVSQAGSLWVSTSITKPHLYVSTTGYVGIGTADPVQNLHIKGTVNNGGSADMVTLGVENAGNGGAAAGFMVDTGQIWALGGLGSGNANHTSDFVIWDATPGREANQPRIVIDWATGGVGVGLNEPQGRLHVNGAGDSHNTSGIADDIVISTTGAVGIGTASPGTNFHIVAATGAKARFDATGAFRNIAIGSGFVAQMGGDGSGMEYFGDFGLMESGSFAGVGNFAGTPRFIVSGTGANAGSVGIGANYPGARLHVQQAAADIYAVKISSNDGAGMFVIQSNGNIGLSTGAPQARLDVLAGGSAQADMAQVWRNSSGSIVSSMSATGVMKAVKFEGDGTGLTGIGGGADNLGNHVATATLQMGAYGVNTSSDITAARYQINGSTVLAVLPGAGSLAVGYDAGRVNTGAGNSFVGSRAGYFNTTGTGNTFVGVDSGRANTTASGGTFVGIEAGYANTTGAPNTFVGDQAGRSNTTGNYNVFMGYQAGYNNTIGASNSFVGMYTGISNTTGGGNSVFGYLAAQQNQTGSANAVFGGYAGGPGNGGPNSFSSSTIMGYKAGYGLSTGSDNILLGFQAGDSLTTGTRNIIIGYDQDAPAATTSNHLNIGGVLYGNLSTGNVGIGVSGPGEKLHILNGNILMQNSGGEAIRMLNNGIANNPEFRVGRIHVAGDGGNAWRVLYADDVIAERAVFEFDQKGIVASVKPTVGSHFEGFISGEVNPLFRLNSYPSMQLEFGPGGNTATDVIMRRVAASTLGFLTGDLERMRIDSSGNVAIGTTTAGARLEVAGQVKITGGAPGAGKVLTSDAAGLATWEAASAPGDNLGNHMATTTLQMGAYGVNTSSHVSAGAYQINGSTVLAVLPGTGSLGVGVDAGRVNTGDYNSFVGYQAGRVNSTGQRNSFVGYQAGYNNTTGASNSFMGNDAGYYNTTGQGNTFMGYSAGYYTQTGLMNSFFGWVAGYDNRGSANTLMGQQAGRNNQTGSANAIFGAEAGLGILNQSFSSSTLMGYRAGYGLTTGSDNILLGFQAGDSLTTGTRNIIIGYDQDAPAATTSNHLNIGGAIYGDLSTGNVGIGTTGPGYKLDINGDMNLAAGSVYRIGGVAQSGTSKWTAGTGDDIYRNTGFIGIGTASPGAKLEVAGQVKITGGSPGAGKVLTSDAAGLAAWQATVSTISIGDSYGGGKIFWLDASGRHGLISTTDNQSTGIQWYNGSFFTTGATLSAVYSGKANTTIIVSTHGAGSYAAKLCADYTVTVNNEYYDDWYLPSQYELGLLYAQKAVVGNFASMPYWSSGEYASDPSNQARAVDFNTGGVYNYSKDVPVRVRCIRAGP